MHFYCTTDFAEIHCSCGFRGFGQGHRHQKSSYPFGYEPFLCCRAGLDEKGVPAKIESSWGEEESRNEVKAHQPDAPAEYSE